MPSGCQQNCHGAATSGLTTPTALNHTPARVKAGELAPMSMREPTQSSSRTCKLRQQPCEGEEKKTLSMSSELAAAPGTPSTSITPSPPPTAMLADSEATPHLHTQKYAQPPKPSCIEHDFQSGRVVHPAPPPLASRPACKPRGLRGRPRRSRGSDDTGRWCAGTHLMTSAAQRQ